MPFRETCAMDERRAFVTAAELGEEPFAALCRAFGISRTQGYKWLERWRQEGEAGLCDRSRAPHHHPGAMPEAVAQACVALRHRHPTWGPAKVRAALIRRAPDQTWPAASTIGALFDRAGLTVRRKFRRRTPPGGPLFAADAVNDVWSIDFKGWFRTGCRTRVDPLTLSDACSRYLLRCQVVDRPDATHVWPILAAAFREYGLPLRLRSDNGPPFATIGAGGLSRLAVKVIKAGVLPERITPGKPQQNGRHERLHLTLLQDTASPPAATPRAQQNRFTAFQTSYNTERPHAALNNATPAECYEASPRPWDGVLRPPETPADTHRLVRSNGTIQWHGTRIYVSEALEGEAIGLTETTDGQWDLSFGPIHLGKVKTKGDKLLPPGTKTRQTQTTPNNTRNKPRNL